MIPCKGKCEFFSYLFKDTQGLLVNRGENVDDVWTHLTHFRAERAATRKHVRFESIEADKTLGIER